MDGAQLGGCHERGRVIDQFLAGGRSADARDRNAVLHHHVQGRRERVHTRLRPRKRWN